jgi:predicted lipid-binding transport protein (Tim44 family)
MRSIARPTVVVALLLAACGQPPAAEQVADQFVQAYFVQNDMAAAVALTGGKARANLAAILQQIEAAGAKEPTTDLPRVTVSLVESRRASADAVRFIYQVHSEAAQVQPITATLLVDKEGGRWHVSEFSQIP